MELREFISATLKDIVGGIRDAQRDLAESAAQAVVNPAWNSVQNLHQHVQVVEFDVAVTATDQKAQGAKGGIKVLSMELGANGEKSLTNSTVSRILFKVPILPSVTTVEGVSAPDGYDKQESRVFLG
jgi:hypothetical protein